MILLRSIIYFTYLVLNTILIATLGSLLIWALPGNSKHIIDHTWSRINLWGLRVFCGLSVRVEGTENIPKESCLVLAKHQSAWETLALISLIPGPKSWVMKRELLNVPFLGWMIKAFQPIAINRKSGRKAIDQIIEQGTDRLNQGKKVFIFPEGTRVAPGEKKRYAIGGAMLAEKSGYPILPVALNSGVFWRRRDIRKYPGIVDVRIGPLIQSQGRKASDLNQEVEHWIEKTVSELPNGRQD
jgi:1-acyl-sn-glycerol-3-phosphate acyltransferase